MHKLHLSALAASLQKIRVRNEHQINQLSQWSGQEKIEETLSNFQRHLLVFDDVFDKIANSLEFLNLVVSGRHKKQHVIFFKHNLYQKSSNSKTINLNLTHLLLLKSPRDVVQIDCLGRQSGDRDLLLSAYRSATEEPYGHLLIDLDPSFDENLRLVSNICTADNLLRLFHIDSKNNEYITLSLSQNQSVLQILTTVKPVLQRLILTHADECFIKLLVDCIFNVVKGNVCVSNKTNTKHTFKRFRMIVFLRCIYDSFFLDGPGSEVCTSHQESRPEWIAAIVCWTNYQSSPGGHLTRSIACQKHRSKHLSRNADMAAQDDCQEVEKKSPHVRREKFVRPRGRYVCGNGVQYRKGDSISFMGR